MEALLRDSLPFVPFVLLKGPSGGHELRVRGGEGGRVGPKVDLGVKGVDMFGVSERHS